MILELEKQVCGLDSAKRLKELGFVQESLFYWIEEKSYPDGKILLLYSKNCIYDTDKVSAYTVAELGELLPERVNIGSILNAFLHVTKGTLFPNKFTIGYADMDQNTELFHEENEAEARAKMLISLKENNLI